MSERSENDGESAISMAESTRVEVQRTRFLQSSYESESRDLQAIIARGGTVEEGLKRIASGNRERCSSRGTVRLSGLRPPTHGGVYAIQAGRHVKIGKSNNISRRLADLQTSNAQQVKLVAVLSRDTSDERRLHEEFAALRAHGEWFHLRGELLQAIYRSRMGA